ncbi:MAG TPA: nucleoside 2-deoxyribosyltransferase [Stellaceae bacterium]|jgi:nucleoside 2-deoxyribosyltransferase|nr:nucleoside 2-deoxyribosyltransferase [Stellaceae bacterium]
MARGERPGTHEAGPYRIYLAGPAVFLPNPTAYGAAKKALCRRYGFQGIFPFDSDSDATPRPPSFEMACDISRINEQLIRDSDMVVADMTPYHGISMDVGTAFEMGFARALGKPVAGYSNCALPLIDRARASLGPIGVDPLGRPQVRIGEAQGMALEDFGMIDNLMLHGAIVHAGCPLVAEDVPAGERYTSLAVFEKLLAALADSPS